MILHGSKKKFLKDVVKYYVDTTGKAYEDFISDISATRGEIVPNMPYEQWLTVKCFEMLKSKEISLADCIENKDVIHSAIKADKSRQEGEFYTPEVWCKEGRKYLQDMLGDLWGKAYIWDASAGTGGLMRTSGYPADKLFMSTLLEEDVPLIEQSLPGATVFQCDFLKGLDSSSDLTQRFSTHLPEKLVEVLKNDEPIVFYMNPPYKVMKSNLTDVGSYMNAADASQFLYEDLDKLKTTSLTKCALDIFHQFMFRMFMLKKTYNLHNMYMGIFGPITMFHSEMLDPLFRIFKQEFCFKGGMCFTAGDFSNTSESVGWVVGYTTWKTRAKDEPRTDDIVLTAKSSNADGEVVTFGERLITRIDENLHDWCKKYTVVEPTNNQVSPVLTNIFSIAENKTGIDYNEALGYMMSSNYVIRATRRACITTLPNTDSIPIVADNFWKCVGSYAARRCYATRVDAFNNCQYYNQPSVTVEGYNDWLLNAFMIMLFDFNAQECSYRPSTMSGFDFVKQNKLFPIDYEIVKSVVTDERVKQDMETYPVQNKFTVDLLNQIKDNLWDESKELYAWVCEFILMSYTDGRREKFGYTNCLEAWDAGIGQLRAVKGYFTKDEEDKYSYLLGRLKAKLFDGVFKYGFMVDTSFGSDTEQGAPVSGESFEEDE